MSADFDPLYQWLGIPPEEQPPHHYRLLGLRPFEENPDVIEAAADRQMAYLRTFHSGPYVRYSQVLLNQVASAKLCLLNLQKKAEYDAWLRAQMTPAAGPPPPPAAQAAVPDLGEVLGDADLYGPSRRRVGKMRRNQWSGLVISISAAVIALAVLAVVAIQVSKRPSHEGTLVVDWPVDERFRGVLEVDGRKVKLPEEGPIELRVPMGRHRVTFTRPGYQTYEQSLLVETGGKSTVRPVWRELGSETPEPTPPKLAKRDQESKTDFEDFGLDFKRDSRPPAKTPRPDEELPDRDAKSQAGQEPALKAPSMQGAQVNAARLAVPDQAAQEQARQRVRDLFKADFDKASNQTQKQALAKKLLQEAMGTENDPAGQYVLLDMARQLGLESGDGLTAYSAVEEMGQRYQVVVVKLKSQILETFAKKAKTFEEHKSVADQAIPAAEQALSEGHLAMATELSKLAVRAATKSRDTETLRRARVGARQIEEVVAAYADVEKAMATLAQQSKDPAANLVVGKYHCLMRGDWETGLPMLAQGSDPTLKALAQRELERVSVPESQAALADEWRLLAAKSTGLAKRQMQSRAVFWYRKALPGLSGLAKASAEKWIKELGAQPGADSSSSRE